LSPAPAAELLSQTRALHSRWNGVDGRISVLVGPSAPQRCSAELLDGCAELSEELDTRVHTHLLESRAQAQDPAAHLAVLDRHGLVNERLIGAHGVWASPDELARLGAVGASLVHNPQSNLQLGSGVAQVPQWRERGINVALGTDGANCGGSLDMLSSMRLASLLHRVGTADERRWESPWTALDMATRGGAQALAMDKTGRVELGWAADLAIFAMDGTAFAACEDPVNALILSATSSRARHVIVAGRLVVEDGVATEVDEAEILERAGEASRAIIERSQYRIKEVALAQRDILVQVARDARPSRPIIDFDAAHGAK
jgi:5-methylthioadenosine/S-adenosylhomocysteine deaminase